LRTSPIEAVARCAEEERAGSVRLDPGLDRALHKALASGRTLAQLANASGKTVPGLEAAMTASFTAHIAAAVNAGRLTKQQAARFTHLVTAHLDEFVQHGFRHHFTPPHSGHS
jgi:hypothetical protein